jgi:hypothetical protein
MSLSSRFRLDIISVFAPSRQCLRHSQTTRANRYSTLHLISSDSPLFNGDRSTTNRGQHPQRGVNELAFRLISPLLLEFVEGALESLNIVLLEI